MSVPIQFTLTAAGQLAVWNAKKSGLSLDLTHIQLGSGNRAPDGSEVALLQAKEAVAIAGGSQITPTQVRMAALFSSNLGYEIREVGLWAGNPANAGSVLVGYWSQVNGLLAVKVGGVDFVFSHDMVFDGALAAGSLNIVADAAQAPLLGMIAAHEGKVDPHPQYVSQAALQLQSFTSFAMAGPAGALTLAANLGIAKLNPGLRLRAKFSTNDTGADTLDVSGLGAKSLKQYDGGGAKVPARFFAGQLGDIEYDGVDWVLLDPAPDFDLTANYDFSVSVQTGVVANTLYAPVVVKQRGVYLISPYSLGWTYGAAGGSYYVAAFAEFVSGTGSTGEINMTPDALPAMNRAAFVLRITSPTASVRFCIRASGSIPAGQGWLNINPPSQGFLFHGKRIG